MVGERNPHHNHHLLRLIGYTVSCWSVSFLFLVFVISHAVTSGETILALLLGFIFSFIGVQSSGDTDINPVSSWYVVIK